jgi:hypothetical protein
MPKILIRAFYTGTNFNIVACQATRTELLLEPWNVILRVHVTVREGSLTTQFFGHG